MERMLDDWVFSTPWWFPAIIMAVGVALWVSGNKRTDKTLRNVGLGVVLLGVAVALVSYFVETKVERVTRRSRELVQSVVDRDWKKMAALLDPKVTLRVQGAPFSLQYDNRDAIISGAKVGVEQIGLGSATVTSIEVQDNGPQLTAGLRVFSTQQRLDGRPTPSDWQIVWEDPGRGWVVTEVTLIQFGQLRGDEAKGQLPR
jgi:hypothetical protein